MSVLLGESLGVFAGLVEVAADVDDLGVERSHRRHLHGIGHLRDADDGGDAKPVDGLRDRLAVGSPSMRRSSSLSCEIRSMPPSILNAPTG